MICFDLVAIEPKAGIAHEFAKRKARFLFDVHNEGGERHDCAPFIRLEAGAAGSQLVPRLWGRHQCCTVSYNYPDDQGFSRDSSNSRTNGGGFPCERSALPPPCCMDRGCGRTEPEPCSGLCNADILWASEVQHTV